ncbi:transglutaminase family protein [Pelobacter seleniigenes]|uniref:transglutaminase family protein n=1 Tax=Pelobacter seleniigenes TaxID=407188 RepID=UPI00069212D6|nr:transglutaminase family protein [Pelobacter seleniigenes]
MGPLGAGEKIVLEVTHQTSFRYSNAVSQSHNELRMSPIDTGLQQVLERHILIDPAVAQREHRDHFGNLVSRFNILEPHQQLDITSTAKVETTNAISCGPESKPDPRPYRERWIEFLDWSNGVPYLEEYGLIPLARELHMDMDEDEFSQALSEMAGYFYRTFSYDPDVTHVYSTPKDFFANGAGVCQDMAHALIGVLRQARIPARYVSGYIFDPPAGLEVGESLRGSGATHAWVQAWHERFGWIGIDPTNNKLVDWQYIRTAVGRDYFDVQPIRGVFQGATEQRMTVAVQVAIAEFPASVSDPV